MTEAARDELLTDLTNLFGGLRAEYFDEKLFDLFTQPTYWPELIGVRPCLLVGGRGTGKTTVLRGLSFEGQRRLTGSSVKSWDFIGMYWRIDTSAVTAFRGAGLAEDQWVRLFGHYANLMLAQSVVDFLAWYLSTDEGSASPLLNDGHALERVCRSLHLPSQPDLAAFAAVLEDAVIDYEAFINNVAGSDPPPLSMQGRPVQLLVQLMQGDPELAGKPVFFLLDEYENLEDYQQRIFNTLIKHSAVGSFTFKIGMRETGHRERATLNPDEQLVEPADYAYIDIPRKLKDGDFAAFAGRVCDERLARLRVRNGETGGIVQLLPSVSEAEEADRLGIQERVEETHAALQHAGATPDELGAFARLEPLSAYLVAFWSEAQGKPIREVLAEAMAAPAAWETRLGNYQHAMLFTVRKRVRGLQKYYAGWATFVQLADGNIRYLLQLVTEALSRQVMGGASLTIPISAEVQTEAAQEIGRRNLQQLQGLAAEGAQLTKLVLSLGRIFQVMAARPEGHAPEVNQFRVNRTGAGATAVDQLLTAAVMHLAVVRFPGDKMAGVSGETRDFDFQLHPVFAPFFVYSYRRKRRLVIDADDVLRLISDPAPTIRQLLARSNRDELPGLPDQLSLFRDFFDEPA